MDSTLKVRLSPRRVAVVMDDTFRIYRDNFLTFVALVAIVTVPLILINTGIEEIVRGNDFATIDDFRQSREDSPWIGILLFVVGLLLNVVVVFSFICYIASENFLGRKATIMQAVRAVRGRLLPLSGALIVSAIIFGILFVVSVIGSAIVIGFFLIPAVFYLMLTVYLYLLPVMILEKVGVFFGMRRAMALGKIRFWPLFGFVIGASLLVMFMAIALILLGQILADSTASAGRFVLALVNSMIVILILPIFPIGMTLMYYDTRVRAEGIDIAFAIAEAESPNPADLFSPPPVGRILSMDDARNVVILACAPFVLMMALTALLIAIGLALS
jgi:hypothetical protein